MGPVPILWKSSGSCTSTFSRWNMWYSACSQIGGIKLNCRATEYASCQARVQTISACSARVPTPPPCGAVAAARAAIWAARPLQALVAALP